ncbi:hypothetical protein J4455_02430 [Candidatus Woesearchaeota archaeon]|nr:hypothetical protein [Candidatus Woesearchaeota archaeon]
MKILVDANRIVAALMKQSTTRDILLDEAFEFVTPDYSISEVEEHRDELQQRLKLTREEFDVLLALLFERITVLPKYAYNDLINECKEAIEDIDDVPYLAACLASKCLGIWSHDPHVLKQKKVSVFTNINMLRMSKSAKSD